MRLLLQLLFWSYKLLISSIEDLKRCNRRLLCVWLFSYTFCFLYAIVRGLETQFNCGQQLKSGYFRAVVSTIDPTASVLKVRLTTFLSRLSFPLRTHWPNIVLASTALAKIL
jgi:hypothetical protein